MVKVKPIYGTFRNGIPYVYFGRGKKKLLMFYGGPGNELPTGFVFNMFGKELEPFAENYTIYIVSRKSGLHEGYTTKDMSNDYAELIRTEFGGKVNLVIGISYGGMIAQHFAADYPDLFDHIVIAMAAHRISEEGKELDYKFAEFLSKGKTSSAYKTIVTALYPKGLKRTVFKWFFWMVGVFTKGSKSETFSRDVMIEAKAEMEHDSTESLSRIKLPVLIICGGRDYYFPIEYVKEMSKLITTCTVKIYPNEGHNALETESFAKDVMDFIK